MTRIDPIKTEIEALTQYAKHLDDAHFTERVEALETLENLVVELADRNPELLQRANALRDELQGINERMFDRYRMLLAKGGFDRAALFEQFAAHTADSRHDTSDNLQYDALDVLIAGVLHASDLANDFELTDAPERALEPEMVAYQPTPARAILKLIREAGITQADTFCDIGAGLGHVPILVALLTGVAAEGIEVQPSHCRHATRCAADLGLERVRFTCQDARSADFSSATIFYLYTPFKGAMLQTVLEKLHDEARSRAIRVCTYGPSLAAAMAHSAFRALKRINANSPIAVFRSAPESVPPSVPA